MRSSFIISALLVVGCTAQLSFTQEQIEAVNCEAARPRSTFSAYSRAARLTASSLVTYCVQVIGPLWTSADANGDNQLSVEEFSMACTSLNIPAETFVNHGSSYANVFAAIDTNGDGYLTTTELASLATTTDSNLQAYAPTFIASVINLPAGLLQPGGLANEMTNMVQSAFPTPAQIASKSKVESKMTITGVTPDQILPKRRSDITAYYLGLSGVNDAKIVFRVKAASRRHLLTEALPLSWGKKRHLQSSVDTEVEAQLYVADDTAAASVAAALPASAADATALPAFSGLPVGAIVTVADVAWSPPMTGLIVVGVVLLLVGILLCCCASMFAKKKRAPLNIPHKSCCDTGCCSYFAIKPWAFGEFVACIFILVGCLMMNSAVGPLQAVLIGLTDEMYNLLNPTVTLPAEISSFTNQIPAETVSSILAQRSLLQYLSFMVMGPGIVSVLFLLLSAICPVIPRRKGSFCCTKIFILLTYVFLGLSLIFYLIFTVIPLGLAYAPESVQAQIREMTGLCITVPMTIEQLVGDLTQTVNTLTTAGLDTSSLTDPTTGYIPLAQFSSTLITNVCGHVNGLFEAFEALFLPGTVCVVSICFAFYANLSLCSSAGCCCPVKIGNDKVGAAKHDDHVAA